VLTVKVEKCTHVSFCCVSLKNRDILTRQKKLKENDKNFFVYPSSFYRTVLLFDRLMYKGDAVTIRVTIAKSLCLTLQGFFNPVFVQSYTWMLVIEEFTRVPDFGHYKGACVWTIQGCVCLDTEAGACSSGVVCVKKKYLGSIEIRSIRQCLPQRILIGLTMTTKVSISVAQKQC
jgi:hypothetical protein